MKKTKKAARNYEPKEKQVRSTNTNLTLIENILEHTPVWQIQGLDLDHDQWGWKNLTSEMIPALLQKLSHYEGRKWKEIFSSTKRDHFVPKDKLTADARRRLQELEQDDVDELYRIRLDGKQRIWGVLEGHIFKVLWWDPKHTVCPSDKKHT